jgi:DNA-binding LacI/PurR family transcriptional regulator
MPGTRKVTSKRVAELAGVSQTTVSFVLNGVDSGNISEETRKRVLMAAAELGYVPNAVARSLARGRSSNIGLVLIRPHAQVLEDTFVVQIVSGFHGVLHPQGLRILIEIVSNESPINDCVSLARSNEVAGMVIIPYNAGPDDIRAIQTLNAEGFPIVSIGDMGADFYCVYADRLSGVRRAVSHLVRLGHRRIACITYGPIETDVHAAHRLQVYRRILEKSGIPYDDALVRYGAHSPESGYQAMRSLLECPSRPTALFAMNDTVAIGAMTAIQEQGLRIPDDIAVIGFDDIPMARYTTPPLTTIHGSDVEQGKRAGELILDLLNDNGPEERQIRLGTQLVIRGSCPDCVA